MLPLFDVCSFLIKNEINTKTNYVLLSIYQRLMYFQQLCFTYHTREVIAINYYNVSEGKKDATIRLKLYVVYLGVFRILSDTYDEGFCKNS